MGKISVQMKDPKLAEVLASTRAGDEVELKDGDAVVGSFVRREGEARPKGVRRFGSLKEKLEAARRASSSEQIETAEQLREHLTEETPESAFDPLPEEELRLWEGRL